MPGVKKRFVLFSLGKIARADYKPATCPAFSTSTRPGQVRTRICFARARERGERGEMPLWSGRCTHTHVRIVRGGPVLVFPEDKTVRDPVHARLAKRATEKAKQVGV